jgi:hypothetical protein
MDYKVATRNTFRSTGRKITLDDDMVRLSIYINRVDELKLYSLMNEEEKDKCEYEQTDMHFTNPHNGTRTYCIGKYCADCGKEIKIV